MPSATVAHGTAASVHTDHGEAVAIGRSFSHSTCRMVLTHFEAKPASSNALVTLRTLSDSEPVNSPKYAVVGQVAVWRTRPGSSNVAPSIVEAPITWLSPNVSISASSLTTVFCNDIAIATS